MLTTVLMLVALAQSPVDAGTLAADAPVRQGSHVCGTVETLADGGVADVPGCKAVLGEGTPAPFDGLEVDAQEDIHRGKHETRYATKVQEYETGKLILSPGQFAGITSGAIAAALAILLGVLAGTGHLK